MGWGYYPIGCDRTTATPIARELVNPKEPYLLVGCEPPSMFRPGNEPVGFRWFWQDNAMLPHLRYPHAHNPGALKSWSRLTHCGWTVPAKYPPQQEHRLRINSMLQSSSGGVIQDIADIWGGIRSTSSLKKRHCLVIRSSDRNYEEFYQTSWNQWWDTCKRELVRLGFTFEVRSKVSPKKRLTNQTVDQIRGGHFDCVLSNHSAAASEAVCIGIPSIVTSAWNPAASVSTTWDHFIEYGDVVEYDATIIDEWVTRCCAYTYHKTELDSWSWVKVHPDAGYLRQEKQNAVYENIR
jgi:hypothetical protein